MKKMVPFTKQIHFKTMIAEVTDIEVTHNLEIKEDNTIEGDILVDGRYKIHEASQLEEKFHYNLPFTIEVDSKYDISKASIAISDFYFEIINEEDLKINVELEIYDVDEKKVEVGTREEIEPIPIEVDEQPKKIEIPSIDEIEEDIKEEVVDTNKNNTTLDSEKINFKITDANINTNTSTSNTTNTNKNYNTIFDTISGDETFVTYYVYIVRETDTIETILDKYHVTREDLSLYNNLDDIKIGTKVIVPCHNE